MFSKLVSRVKRFFSKQPLTREEKNALWEAEIQRSRSKMDREYRRFLKKLNSLKEEAVRFDLVARKHHQLYQELSSYIFEGVEGSSEETSPEEANKIKGFCEAYDKEREELKRVLFPILYITGLRNEFRTVYDFTSEYQRVLRQKLDSNV